MPSWLSPHWLHIDSSASGPFKADSPVDLLILSQLAIKSQPIQQALTCHFSPRLMFLWPRSGCISWNHGTIPFQKTLPPQFPQNQMTQNFSRYPLCCIIPRNLNFTIRIIPPCNDLSFWRWLWYLRLHWPVPWQTHCHQYVDVDSVLLCTVQVPYCVGSSILHYIQVADNS